MASRSPSSIAGELNQNAYMERFNRTFRHEVLDALVFISLAEVKVVSEER